MIERPSLYSLGLQRLGLDQPDVRVLVVGLGATGVSVIRFLRRFNINVAVVDSREFPPYHSEMEANFPDVAVFVGQFSDAAFSAATHLVVSPGVPLDQPAIRRAADRGVPILGDIDLFACCVEAPVAGITGSNGKSTVTTLVGEMAKQAGLDVRVGGNLGTPALDLLQESEPDLYVLELSSFQLERTSHLAAKVSAFLNLSLDHIDHHGDYEAYRKAKTRIFHGPGVAVVNREDPAVMADLPPHRRIVTFGLDEPESEMYGIRMQSGESWLCKGEQKLCATSEMRILGRHNHANALACLAMADALKLPLDPCLEALKTFRGLPHRMEWIGATDNGVAWINDSKATNPGATLAAIEGLQSKLVLIAGGDGKGADFEMLRDAVKDRVRVILLIGKDAARIKDALGDVVRCVMVGTLDKAIDRADHLAEPGDVVLLSPACASLDQFSSYAARGDQFRQSVEAMIRG